MDIIGKVCCVFPGQGSQYGGMGKDLYDKYPSARKIFNIGNKILRADLKFDITDLMFDGSEEDLEKTINCQVTMLLHSSACFVVLNENKKILCLLTLGHSIGEYSALVASKALSLEDAIKLVRIRSGLMSKCIPKEIIKGDTDTPHYMAAVLTENHGLVYNICKIYSSPGNIVQVAAENSKDQIVISGNNNAVIEAAEYFISQNIKVIYLPVEGPFHSELMRPAAEGMKKVLEDKVITINELKIPYIPNFTADIVYDSDKIEKPLVNQICGTVRWKESLETAIKMATEKKIKIFIECGPGDVQTKLLKRNPLYKDITVLGVKDYIN